MCSSGRRCQSRDVPFVAVADPWLPKTQSEPKMRGGGGPFHYFRNSVSTLDRISLPSCNATRSLTLSINPDVESATIDEIGGVAADDAQIGKPGHPLLPDSFWKVSSQPCTLTFSGNHRD